MVPESYETFFLATAGAGGAFVGLLFIAISISPQRTFDPHAVAGVQHQRLAEATLLTLFNGFVVSCVALIPDVNIGWITLVLGGAGVLIAAQLVGFLARAHRHVVSRRPPWLHRLRVVSLSVVASLLYGIEGLLGLQLILRPHDENHAVVARDRDQHLYARDAARLDPPWRSAARVERVAQSVAGPRARARGNE
jgi:hypothetical protein